MNYPFIYSTKVIWTIVLCFLSFLKLDILLCGYILWFHPMEKSSPYVILCSMKVTMKMCTGLNMNLKIRKITT